MIKLSLEGFGYQVIGTASDGEMAIAEFKNFNLKPDIIIMDHRMPKKNGIEASIEILKINKEMNIIFTTGDDEIRNQAINIGVKCVILKPFSINKLLDQIELILNEK